MTILGNIHEADRGRRVVTTATVHGNRLAADFPGWGDPDYARFLVPIPAGLTGTVASVESHGSNPWTRYYVRFDDGSRAPGMCYGQDFVFADGQLQRDRTRDA